MYRFLFFFVVATLPSRCFSQLFNTAGNPTCEVCGPNQHITEIDALVNYQTEPAITCENLQNAGRNGLISPDTCGGLPAVTNSPCQCEPIVAVPSGPSSGGGGGSVPAPTPTTSGQAGNPTCFACGHNQRVSNPAAIVDFPGQPIANCETIETAGFNGFISEAECVFLPAALKDICGCEAYSNTGGDTPSPTTVPTPAPADQPACNICGGDSSVTKEAGIIDFPGQPITNCGILSKAGQDGLLTPAQCSGLPGAIGDICQCSGRESGGGGNSGGGQDFMLPEDEMMEAGAIVGIVIGVLLGITVIGFVVALFFIGKEGIASCCRSCCGRKPSPVKEVLTPEQVLATDETDESAEAESEVQKDNNSIV